MLNSELYYSMLYIVCGNCKGQCDTSTGMCVQGCSVGYDYSNDTYCQTGTHTLILEIHYPIR